MDRALIDAMAKFVALPPPVLNYEAICADAIRWGFLKPAPFTLRLTRRLKRVLFGR